MSFAPTIQILVALKSRLEALTLSPGVPAFEKVEFFSQPRLVEALQELDVFKNRVCLIVPDGDEFSNELSGRILVTHCARRLILLLADRDLGKRQGAATGDGNTPGVIQLSELVIADLTGQSLGLNGVRIRPEGSQPVLITGKEREQTTGREAWHIDLSVDAGVLKT